MPSAHRNIDNLSEMAGLLPRTQLAASEPLPVGYLTDCHDSDGGDAWSATNATAAVDTEDYYFGTESLKATIDAGATGSVSNTLPFAVNVRGCVGVVVKIDDLTKLDYGYVYLSEDDGTNGYRSAFYNRTTSPVNAYSLIDDEWAVCWIRRKGMSEIGSPTAWGDGVGPDTYSVAHVKLEIVAVSGQQPVVRFGGILHQKFPKMGVIFHFDDYYQSIYTNAFPILAQKGWLGNCAVIGSKIDSGELNAGIGYYATSAQTQVLYDAGWDMLNHSYEHKGGSTVWSTDELGMDIRGGKRWLDQKGWTRASRFYLSPGMKANCVGNNVIPLFTDHAVAARGRCLRTSADPTWFTSNCGCPWIPYDVYNLSYQRLYTDYLSEAYATIAETDRDRAVVRLYVHDVQETPSAYGVSIDTFAAVCDVIQGYVDAGTAEVITESQWWDRTWAARQIIARSRTSA
jgi:peptidoglycan/xylan/chitin deacetylase (PgdA/CDA1 family)